MQDNPILNSPYNEPRWHYATDLQGNLNYEDIRPGRRIFDPTQGGYTIPLKKQRQGSLLEVNEMTAEYGERKAYLHIGPQFGTVSRQSVTTSMCSFEVTKVRMHDDLLQEGLTKKDKKAASFVTIGEPDIRTVDGAPTVQVEIRGLDIYDPIRDEVRARSVADIAYWMVDDDYDGANFIVRQVFFCGGEKEAFKKWQKGISNVANRIAKMHAERRLRIELDDEAWDRLYGFVSHPIPAVRGRRIAVRVVSQFGEESLKVVTI